MNSDRESESEIENRLHRHTHAYICVRKRIIFLINSIKQFHPSLMGGDRRKKPHIHTRLETEEFKKIENGMKEKGYDSV